MNKIIRNNSLRAAIVLGLGSFAVSGFAVNTSTIDLPVSATIAASCVLSTQAVNFGTYDPNGGDVDTTGTFTWECTDGNFPQIFLDEGHNPGEGSTLFWPIRQMASGNDLLQYNLYTDANRIQVWGGAQGYPAPGLSASATIYARIPGGQTGSPPGSYVDIVTVTLQY